MGEKAMAFTTRILLLLALITVSVSGCTDRSETETPAQPLGLRKKIAMPEKPQTIAQSGKPQEGEGTKMAVQKGPQPGREGVQSTRVESPEPSVPDKKGLMEPEKSDSLKLAEGMTAKNEVFYDPAGKHDPFESPFEAEVDRIGVAPAKQIVEKKRVPLTPLQRIALSQLKLVAIVLSPTGNKALVEDPSGKGYIISKGTYIGQDYGRVTEILEDKAIVEAEVEDFLSGNPKLQTTELRLHKELGDS
jgi:Tfp pilus assembly protein PilP